MIDIKLVKSDPEFVRKSALKRNIDLSESIEKVLTLDGNRREIIGNVEKKRAEQRKLSKEIPVMAKNGIDNSAMKQQLKSLSDEIKFLNSKLSDVESELKQILEQFPNIPDEDVVAGAKENNQVLKYFGKKPEFSFKIKNHVEICEDLNLIDYSRGAKLSGSGSWIYTNMGARLEWALINFFIEEHLKDGYEFILPPHMLSYNCGYVAGQFPKFSDEVFWLDNQIGTNKKFLLPTAETALVNLHADEILSEKDLPKKYFSYTPCFRREAGSYRSEERGMIRGHQFNKVEMLQYTKREDSSKAFEELLTKACSLMEKLGLHYRCSKLAAADCSFSMARTYDIEVWIPSISIYKEVSSVSCANDYQARRGNIRYKNKDGKTEFVHTLNASGLATSRLFPAIIEQYQNEDGSVTVPKVLQKYISKEKLSKE